LLAGRVYAAAAVLLAACVVLFAAAAAGARGGSAASPPAPPAARGELPEPDPLLRDLIGFRVRYRDLLRHHPELVRTVRVTYRAWNGERRYALLVLPRWYGPVRHPRIPLVISPHGRGLTPRANTRFWGALPAFGPFAVVSPEGQGRRLIRYSWGWRGQIDDLARLPRILESELPWLRVDRRRVYAVGSSMGGQETLLLVARHPSLLAGASALDSATDMAARYRAFPQLPGGLWLQQLARIEIGGTPTSNPAAYASRSPIRYAAQIAASGCPCISGGARETESSSTRTRSPVGSTG
jgi:pimeloyl-ACP methyl ester carboxylesterase